MPNWEIFNKGLGDFTSALANQQREKVKRQRGVEDLISQLLIKSQIESAMKKQVMQDMFDKYKEMGYFSNAQQPGGSVMPGTTPNENIVGLDRNRESVYRSVPTGDPNQPWKLELRPEVQIQQKVEEAKAVKKAQMTEELNVKRQQYGKDLSNFLAIDDILQENRGEGFGRFGAGIRMTAKGVAQKGKLGQAVGAYDAVSKRLRVQLVRAAGDVGNINIVEQEAAEKLIPAKSDSKQTAAIKRAYLMEISKAIDSQDPSLVKTVLDKLGINYTESKKDFSNLWE